VYRTFTGRWPHGDGPAPPEAARQRGSDVYGGADPQSDDPTLGFIGKNVEACNAVHDVSFDYDGQKHILADPRAASQQLGSTRR
jgi:hypothetical protein